MVKKIFSLAIVLVLLFSLAACDTGTELANYKTEAKEAIDTYAHDMGQENYTEENWVIICDIVSAGKTAIDVASNMADVDSAVTTAKEEIDEVQKEDKIEWGYLGNILCHTSTESSPDYWNNIGKSRTAYEEAIVYFTITEKQYTDDFGGVFIDSNGIYNICIVGNREPVESDYLIYKQVNNSYNFLYSIFKEVGIVMKEYSVWITAPCVSCNRVLICLENESDISLIVAYLRTKDLFKKDTLNFFVGVNQIISN